MHHHERSPHAPLCQTVGQDGKGKSIINFLVNYPRGAMLIKSIDVSRDVKDAQLLCKLLDMFIWEIGI